MTSIGSGGFIEIADLLAMRASAHHSALDTHRVLAEEIWTVLRTLGFDSGRVLAWGDDPATFLGLPNTTGRGAGAVTATVGPDHEPGNRLPVTDLRQHVGEKFDVVLTAIPFNDVAYHSRSAFLRGRTLQNALTLSAVDLTKPGGITVVLASNELLDMPYTGTRHELSRLADLVGAVRLPSGIQRPVPRLSAVTDLVMLHRLRPGDVPRALECTSVAPIVVDGQLLALNSYYDCRPDYMLGRIGAEATPWGSARLTVTAEHQYFAVDLNTQLERIATQAHHDGVVLSTTPGALPRTRASGWRHRLDQVLGPDVESLDDGLDVEGPGHGLG